MKLVRLLLLSATLFCPLMSMAVENASDIKASSTITTTLGKLGYPSGLVFDDSSLPHERTLLFYLPKDMPIRSASLRILYRGTPQLSYSAALGVAINEGTQETIPLMADSDWRVWRLSIPDSELNGGQLKITLRGDIPPHYDSVTKGEAQSGLVRISADSSLTTVQDGVPPSLRDAWLTLPDEVLLTIPSGPLDEATFRAALDWITLLQRRHHTVRLTTLPELGNLVIAPAADIAAAIARRNSETEITSTLWGHPGVNLGVVTTGGSTFIAATPPYANVQQFISRWQVLTHPTNIESTPPGKEMEHDKVLLSVLGMSTATGMLEHKLQWDAMITPWNLPPGTRPQNARLHLLLPRTETNRMIRIFVYLNDMMVESERMPGDGTEQQIEVSFDSVPRSDTYHLRVVARDGDALVSAPSAKHYPMRITPQSHITVKKETRTPAGLSSLPTALGRGFDLYVPGDYLSESPRYLPLLARLLSGFVLPQTDYRLIVVHAGQVPKPLRNFIVAGDLPLGEAPLPVRFDEGKVQLMDYRGETLLGEQRLRMGNVIQLMNYRGMTGLWLHPGEKEGMPEIDANQLGSDDVAVYETDKLVLSFDSHQEDLAYLQYPEAPRWYERLHQQRFIWLFVAWVMITLGIVYLYSKSKQHRKV